MFRSFFFLLDEVKVVWFYTIQFEAGCSFPILWVSPRNRDARRNLNEFFPFGLLFNRGRSRGETFSNNFPSFVSSSWRGSVFFSDVEIDYFPTCGVFIIIKERKYLFTFLK